MIVRVGAGFKPAQRIAIASKRKKEYHYAR